MKTLSVILIWYIIYNIFAGSQAGKQCPQGWYAYKNNCYFFSSASVNWNTAKSICATRGGKLSTINDLNEAVSANWHYSEIYVNDSQSGNRNLGDMIIIWVVMDTHDGNFKRSCSVSFCFGELYSVTFLVSISYMKRRKPIHSYESAFHRSSVTMVQLHCVNL
mgnify:FL=1